MPNTNYDTDFYAWANEQAALLRAGALTAADIENIAEEIESMGKGEKRELKSRLQIIVLHLLKWQFQPAGRGSSWETTIRVQRIDLVHQLSDNPSLKAQVPDVMGLAFGNARLLAADETKMSPKAFPAKCPYSLKQIMDKEFWPE